MMELFSQANHHQNAKKQTTRVPPTNALKANNNFITERKVLHEQKYELSIYSDSKDARKPKKGQSRNNGG